MKYNHLRAHIKKISPAKSYVLKDCQVLIDGRSFFKQTYKRSGCESILGGEYDRYAVYLKSLLKPLIDTNVTCHVIFNGAMDVDLEKRQTIHQDIVNRVSALNPKDKELYCDPIFVKDVWKEVLDELGIKYYITEYDSTKAMIWVAKKLQCPIMTQNYEYVLLGLSCIHPKSLNYDPYARSMSCEIFEYRDCQSQFRIKNDVLPLFFTLADEDSLYFKRLFDIISEYKVKNLMAALIRWARWQWRYLEVTIKNTTKLLSQEQGQAFLKAYEQNSILCDKSAQYWPIIFYFKENYQNQSFEAAVAHGEVAVPYVNLTHKGIFSGSWVVFDKDQDDAMLLALDIIFCVYSLLKNEQNLKITFIGRKIEQSCIWEIEKELKQEFPNCPEPWLKSRQDNDLFQNFIKELMPGFDMKILESAPEDSWVLIISLVYFCKRKFDACLAYSMILSFVMLRLVSDKVGVIKRTYFMNNNDEEEESEEEDILPQKECIKVVDSLMELFYMKNLKKMYDPSVLHLMAEFQHCLQHMNYLNRLCGEKIKCTVYNKSLNATFIYNMYCKLKDKECPTKYLGKRLKNSSVFDCYTKIESVFEGCLMSVGMGLALKD